MMLTFFLISRCWFHCHFHRCTTSVKCKRWRIGGEPKQRRNREFCTPGSVNSNKCWWCLVGVTALYDRCSNAVTPFSDSNLNPLHPTISMHILHTALQTFPKVLTRRICLLIKSFFRWWSFLYSHDLNVLFRGDIVGRKLMLVTRRVLRVKNRLNVQFASRVTT